MNSSQLYASAMFASRNPALAEKSQFGALLRAAESACAPLPLPYYFTCTTSGGVSRGKQIEQREELLRPWLRSTTCELHNTSLDPYAHTGWEVSAQVTFLRNPVSYRRPSVENFLQSVSLSRSIGPGDTARLLGGVKELFRLLDAPSGYIHVATDQTLVQGELGFTSMGPARPLLERKADGAAGPAVDLDWLNWKHPEDTNDRIEQLALVRSQVGPRLRGTYWGTFLGRELVDELGGESRIAREAPVAVVESLDGGGMYLQLTPSPEPITTPVMQRGLVALERFLEPVLVPTPLYFATRNFDS